MLGRMLFQGFRRSSALVFTSPLGRALRNSNFRRQVWYRAVFEAGLPSELRIHDLRHTCASLLISEPPTF